MDLRDYLTVIARFWRVVVATTLVGVLAAVATTAFLEKEYTATTRVFFTADGGDKGQDLAYAANYAQTRLQTYKGLAKTPSVLQAVVDENELDESADQLSRQVEVTTSQISTIVEVAVTDTSAKQARTLANSVGAALIQAVALLEKPDDSPKAYIRGTIVGPATLPESPSTPNLPLNVLVGLAAGLGVGLLVSVVRYALTLGRPEAEPVVVED